MPTTCKRICSRLFEVLDQEVPEYNLRIVDKAVPAGVVDSMHQLTRMKLPLYSTRTKLSFLT